MYTVIPFAVGDETAVVDKTLRLAVIFIEEPPYIYVDENAEYLGMLPNLAKAFSCELALDLRYLPAPRKDLEKSVIEGRADMTWLSPSGATLKNSGEIN